jgi:subtilisin-like proprotein convertase family protein
VLSGLPTAETEPNGTTAMATPLPANGWVSGTINPTGDSDFFAVSANAGDTIVAVLDANPLRGPVIWNPRLGIGTFNSFLLVVDDPNDNTLASDPNSEAHFMTVKTTGTYYVYVDAPGEAGSSSKAYWLSVSVLPGGPACSTYQGATGGLVDNGTKDFQLSIPTSQVIDSLQLELSIDHPATADLDISLISPEGDEVVLVDDSPTTGNQPTPQIDTRLDDEAGIPITSFGVNNGMSYQPESYSRLAFFKGMRAQGTWTLRIRDDTANNQGNLNFWSLTVCTAPAVCSGQTLYSNTFEAGDGGFTHSGGQDEWERGLPSFAPITTAHSGTNAWKTDLDNTYNPGSNQNLVSPNIVLPASSTLQLTWWQKYQLDTASLSSAWVEIRDVGNPSDSKRLWEWKGATMTRSVGPSPATTVQESAGWARTAADISSFGGKTVQVVFHLDSIAASLLLAGLAIDDVAVDKCSGPTAVVVLSFAARRVRAGVVLTWRTASELGLAGYDVYADVSGVRTKVNRRLIAARGVSGAEYRFVIRGRPAARFWLEAVRVGGTRTRYGPAAVRLH